MSTYPGLGLVGGNLDAIVANLRRPVQPVVPEAQAAAPEPTASDFMSKLQAIINAPMPQAPIVQEDQGSLAKALDRVYPDIDWEAEAQKLVEKSGLKPPGKPGDLKISPWMWLAALGPALGALAGGSPALAAPGMAAVLGGYVAGWDEKEKKYVAQQAAYTKTVTDLAEKMATRQEKRATMLLPYLTMTAEQRAKNNIDTVKLIAGLGHDQQVLALRAMEIANQELAHRSLREHQQRQDQIAEFSAVNKALADRMHLEETDRHNREQELIEKERNAISRFSATEAAQYHNALVGVARERLGSTYERTKLEVFNALVETARTGSKISPQLEMAANIAFPNWKGGRAEDKILVTQYIAALKAGKGVDPKLEAAGKAAMARMGQPMPEEPQTPSTWDRFWNFITYREP